MASSASSNDLFYNKEFLDKEGKENLMKIAKDVGVSEEHRRKEEQPRVATTRCAPCQVAVRSRDRLRAAAASPELQGRCIWIWGRFLVIDRCARRDMLHTIRPQCATPSNSAVFGRNT